jgi:hypothetical protein
VKTYLKISDTSKISTIQATSDAKKCNCTLECTFTKTIMSKFHNIQLFLSRKVRLHFLVRAPTRFNPCLVAPSPAGHFFVAANIAVAPGQSISLAAVQKAKSRRPPGYFSSPHTRHSLERPRITKCLKSTCARIGTMSKREYIRSTNYSENRFEMS